MISSQIAFAILKVLEEKPKEQWSTVFGLYRQFISHSYPLVSSKEELQEYIDFLAEMEMIEFVEDAHRLAFRATDLFNKIENPVCPQARL